MTDLLQRVADGPVAADCGIGTQLLARGLKPGASPEAWNLDRPEKLTEIARAAFTAGAELVTTNTFGGSVFRLRAYELEDRCDEINRSGVQAVRTAVGQSAVVLASLGPSGEILSPVGTLEPAELRRGFEQQAAAFLGAGADAVCVETMTDLTEATIAIEAVRSAAPGLPIIATMTFDSTPRGFFTVMGVSLAQGLDGLAAAGADLVGSNCGHGMATMVDLARQARPLTELPLVVQANAGMPEYRGGEVVYPETPEDFAAAAIELLDIGVSVIGGCCGTTPEHVRAVRQVVDRHR